MNTEPIQPDSISLDRLRRGAQRVRLRVPALFFLDHANRACVQYSGDPDEYIISRNSRTVEVSLHPTDVGDLLNDAHYYDSFDSWDRADNRSVCGSARSTIKALARHGVELKKNPYANHWHDQ